MGSPVFVKKVWLCGGALAGSVLVIRLIVEPIGGWDKSLRTIFMDKNICAYCGYMGLNSLVNFQPDTRCRCTLFLHRRKSAHAPERARILQDGA
ncbi:hypothetical protein [Paraburkholderia sabiae]|uniref:hypothetical protein n=1 Tax=Paraburkholderia sabiae TaxID=273251 RepID=UPI001CC68948|nr:hypothetical protein [Paraburkholderia sabiae]